MQAAGNSPASHLLLLDVDLEALVRREQRHEPRGDARGGVVPERQELPRAQREGEEGEVEERCKRRRRAGRGGWAGVRGVGWWKRAGQAEQRQRRLRLN